VCIFFQAFIGDLDLWCTTKQLLDIGAGDEEEHAVMLYNMLYHLALKESGAFGRDDSDTPRSQHQTQGQGQGQEEEDAPIRGRREGSVHSKPGKQASHTVGYPSDSYIRDETVFLALGDAVPEGRTVYVLIKDTRKQGISSSLCSAESYLIINPSTGHVYSAGDSSCPLRSILVLITPYNLWANIQVDATPRMTLYDILNVDHWRPFFGARLPPPTGGLQSVQVHTLLFMTLHK
jgi:hypothetical protein